MSRYPWIRERKFWLMAAPAIAILLSPLCLLDLRAADEEEPPIVKYMETINTGYKLLRREARRKSFTDATIVKVVGMQKAAFAALHEEFSMAKDAKPAERKKIVVGYMKIQAALVTELMNLEIALLEGRKDDAAKMVDNLAAIKKKGHDGFVEDE